MCIRDSLHLGVHILVGNRRDLLLRLQALIALDLHLRLHRDSGLELQAVLADGGDVQIDFVLHILDVYKRQPFSNADRLRRDVLLPLDAVVRLQ